MHHVRLDLLALSFVEGPPFYRKKVQFLGRDVGLLFAIGISECALSDVLQNTGRFLVQDSRDVGLSDRLAVLPQRVEVLRERCFDFGDLLGRALRSLCLQHIRFGGRRVGLECLLDQVEAPMPKIKRCPPYRTSNDVVLPQ
jgi:hypothetical protein